MWQFDIFKRENLIQGISDTSFGPIKKGNSKNIQAFFSFLGYKISLGQIVWAEQVFGNKVHVCQKEDSGKIIKGVDGLVSNVRGQILSILTGDCLPILLFDPQKEAVGILHGSRKSLLKGIIENGLLEMKSIFKSRAESILVGIGPHIRRCHYYLGSEIFEELKNTSFKKYFVFKDKKFYFDLTKLTIDKLLKAGIKKENIEDCQICTFCNFKEYYSRRKQKENPTIYPLKNPNFGNFLGLKK